MNKKEFKLLPVLFALIIVFSACNKKEDKDEFGPKTPEETKITIEQTGIEMISQMRALEQSQAIDVSESFIYCLATSDPMSKKSASIYSTAAFKSVKNVAEMDDDVHLSRVLEDMRSTDDPETLQELFNSVAGVYEWNAESEYWEETLGGDEIVFKFPTVEGSTTNDGIFRIFNYTGYNGDNYLKEYDEYKGDLPQTLNAELKAGDVTVMTYFFNIGYDSDGIPQSIKTELFVVPFTFSAEFDHDYSKGKIVYKIEHNGEEVVNLTAEAKGNWTKDNIDANITEDCETYPDYIYNPETDTYDETEITYCYDEILHPENIFKTASMEFRIMDVKMVGTLNFAGLYPEMMDLDEKYWGDDTEWENWTEEKDSMYTLETIEVSNKNISLTARTVADNKIIAILEAYPYVYTYTYESNWYNDEYYDTPIVITEKEYYEDFRFVFGDESKVDAETYFGDGFNDFVNDLNKFITDLNKIYDTDIEPIEY